MRDYTPEEVKYRLAIASEKIRETGLTEMALTYIHELEQTNNRLQGENKQLRADYKVLSCSVGDFDELQNRLEEEQRKNNGLSDDLAKAKEYIKLLLMNCVGVYKSTGKTVAEIQADAKQFLEEKEYCNPKGR